MKSKNQRKLSVYSNLAHKHRTKKDARARKKAEYLATLPKHPVGRVLARMHPKRVAGFWFSRKGLMTLLKISAVSITAIILLVAGTFAYFRKDLDSIRPSELAKNVQTTVTKYYARDGKTLLWEDKGDGDYKMVVDGTQISPIMKKATIAIEDRDFYKHGGVSFTGIARSLLNNANGGNVQGGSTLTQQLVKQVFFANEAQKRGLNGVPRKIKEIILSIEVERMYNKDQILDLYLNESPYGGRRNGVESGARTYFNKSAKDLNLSESALLASIPNQPGLYDPYTVIPGGQQALIARQHKVLDAMAEQGFVTTKQAEEAKAIPIMDTIQPQSNQFSDIKAPHFVQMVRSQLESELGKATVGKGGLTIITSLDWDIQQRLQQSFDEMFNEKNPKYKGTPEYAGFNNGAATVEDSQTGQIVALMGSRDYHYPGFGQDNASTAFIQPGSTIKPLVYAQLFSQQKEPAKNIYGSGTVLSDTKTTFPGGYTPNNADKGFRGNISIRQSLGLSRNIPAIKAMSISGVKPTIDMIRAAGDSAYCTVGADREVDLAAAIGGCGTRQIDHVNAFATLARQGVYKPTATILEVRNSQGEKLQEWKDTSSKKVIDPQVSYIVSDMLSDDNARAGLYGRNFPGLVVDRGRVKTAAKTGTSDVGGKSKDIWMMSYSPALTMGVWFGNPDTSPLKNGNSSLPGVIINDVMTYAHQTVYKAQNKWKEGNWYVQPAGIIKIGTELYPSWYNKNAAQKPSKATFDKVSKKKATNCTPDAAKIEVDVLKSIDPVTKQETVVALNGYDGSKDDDVHKCDDAKPTVSGITITPVSGGTYTIKVTVSQGKNPLTNLDFKVAGNVISSMPISGSGDYTANYTFPNSGTQAIGAAATDSGYYVSEAAQDFPVVGAS